MLCSSCGAPVRREDRQCQHCRRAIPDARPPRPLVPQPARFHVDEGFDLQVSWSWWTPAVLFLIPFAIAWNTFLIGWYAMASAMPDEMGFMQVVFLVFPLAHVAVGLGLIYAIAVSCLNKTRISVEDGLLRVWHGPIFYPGSCEVPIDEIQQLYVTGAEHRGENSINFRYTLKALLRGGREQPLVGSLTSHEEGVYLEQLLEKRLQIEDAEVAGEVAGTAAI